METEAGLKAYKCGPAPSWLGYLYGVETSRMVSLRSISCFFALAVVTAAMGQELKPLPQGVVAQLRVVDGDTLPMIRLATVEIGGRYAPRDRREAERYDRLVRNVQKVYPYARITADLLKEYEHDLATISREADRDVYVKLAEAELKAEFEADIRDLTDTQGRILVKLIDRETGRTSYSLVQELRGSFQAFMWQGLARLFGQDLKSRYDPEGEDNLIELVVARIERGELDYVQRGPRSAKAQARLEKRKQRLHRKYGLQASSTKR